MSRPMDSRRARWQKKYHLSRVRRRHLTIGLLEQLSACKSEAARRLLLGVSRRRHGTTLPKRLRDGVGLVQEVREDDDAQCVRPASPGLPGLHRETDAVTDTASY